MTSRIDSKRRADINYKKRQFAEQPAYAQVPYRHRLNFYNLPPTADITLEEFEEWAIHRLKGMSLQVARVAVNDKFKYWPNSKPAHSATEVGMKPSNT